MAFYRTEETALLPLCRTGRGAAEQTST